MSASPQWKESLRLFFAGRANDVRAVPTHEDLCWISGADPRVWAQTDVYDDQISNILALCNAGKSSHVLEVGCAGGLLAKGIAPRVARYTGIDLAKPVLEVARKLGLGNASFDAADGGRLRYADNSFDAALCYNVFINLPVFDDGVPLIKEMIRVVKPGGKVLVGSIPDESTRVANEERVKQVGLELEAKFGPLKPRAPAPAGGGKSLRERIAGVFAGPQAAVDPMVLCYYFSADDFLALGSKLDVQADKFEIHRLNPYFGYRYNVVYTKPRT